MTDIHVIDLDTIDITNLNRQFLFRMKDVGRGKAVVAAEFINQRIPGVNIIPYVGKIQDKDVDFYKQFKVIICGLDNIDARRWLNSMIMNLVQYDSDGQPIFETIIPIVDGGTEGFKGQARLIIPKCTACFECTLESFPPQVSFPLCTIAETPRIPEHCIAYAFIIEWERTFPGKKLDKDNPEDMNWVYQTAAARAERYGIEGVTYFRTLGVVKNIIPAIASTNAIISAACVNECMKILSYCSQSINNYYMYMGVEGVYSPTFIYEKKDDCVVCGDGAKLRYLTVPGYITLADLMTKLDEHPAYQLKKPSIRGAELTLYMQSPPFLEEATRKNLKVCLNELISDGEIVSISDPTLNNVAVEVQITFEK